MDPDLNVTIDFPLTGIPPLTDAMRQAIIAANAPPAKVPPMPAPVPPPSSIEPTKFEWSEPVMGVQILVKVVDMTRPGFLKPVTRISDLPISVEVRNRGSDGSPLAIWQKHDQTGGVEFFTKDDQGQRIPVTGTSALYATRATSVARGDGEDDIIRMPFRTFAQLKGDLYASITFVDAATGQPFEVVSPPIKGAAIASFLNSLNPEVFSSIKSITTSSAPAPTAPSP